MGLYFAAILLLLGAYYFFYGSMGIPAVTFAQVETLFEDGKVISFSIRDGNDLYLNLTDGSARSCSGPGWGPSFRSRSTRASSPTTITPPCTPRPGGWRCWCTWPSSGSSS